jgi:hypothetical protein
MSFGKTAIVLAATVVLGTFGVSPAYAGSPHCGVFDENNGTVSIVSEGVQFSLNQLMNDGRFSARGPQFGCWQDIGTASQLRDTMMYSYRVTDNKGESKEFGPYGIQPGGFGNGSIAAYTGAGTWHVEYLLVSRDNGSKSSIGATTFTMVP